MAGIAAVADLPADAMGSVIYAMLVEDNTVEGTSRVSAREAVDDWMAEAHAEYSRDAAGTKHDPETWGLLPEHASAAEYAIMMATELTGGAPNA